MQKFNKPLEHLNVKLRPSGEIKEILNQKDIEDKWLLLKEELSPEMGDTLEEKQMLEGGDNDFKNSLPLLKNSLLHRLFFMDLYKSYTISDTFYSVAPLKYTSQIFNQVLLILLNNNKKYFYTMEKRNIRINLEDKLFPVQAYFNSIPDRSFIRVLQDFSKNIGSGFEETSISFPEEAEKWGDEPFKGVEFGIFEKEIIISNEDFIKYLRIVCNGYNKDHQHQKEEVEKLFNTIKVNFLSKDS